MKCSPNSLIKNLKNKKRDSYNSASLIKLTPNDEVCINNEKVSVIHRLFESEFQFNHVLFN